MNILGINAYHGDAAACLVVDGQLIAAAEEERFTRVKHWAGFPTQAIRACLNEAGLSVADLDHVAVNRDPSAHFLRKASYALSKRPSASAVADRLKNASRVRNVRKTLALELGVPPEKIRAAFHSIEHHRAHASSSFFVSGFDRAAVVSVDGFGDFVSTTWGTGSGNRIEMKNRVYFPHSLGLLYLAGTQHLGFPQYGDEYKVMGLAAYGRPSFASEMSRLVRLKGNGLFELDLSYFQHHAEGVSMEWENGQPKIGRVFSKRWEDLLGPARVPETGIEARHQDLAASLQKVYEEAFFHLLRHVERATGEKALCLAGGCAMNSVANGKIFGQTGFRELYVQAAAGDAGGALGAAFAVWNGLLRRPRVFRMDHAFWGDHFTEAEIESAVAAERVALEKAGCVVESLADENELCRKAAARVAAGDVVGWFQGRMEWGPRALGNRSIVCDPRRADMRDILNLKIKRRELFRPFAPSVLEEKCSDWFEGDGPTPFMLEVRPVRPEKRGLIPAVTHVDGSGRLQTVSRAQNPLYHGLIRAFESLTGVPMLLNTSFNESEPIVRTPAEALDCFVRTRMDVLVMGNTVISRR